MRDRIDQAGISLGTNRNACDKAQLRVEDLDRAVLTFGDEQMTARCIERDLMGEVTGPPLWTSAPVLRLKTNMAAPSSPET
jgi:hypothetical protein